MVTSSAWAGADTDGFGAAVVAAALGAPFALPGVDVAAVAGVGVTVDDDFLLPTLVTPAMIAMRTTAPTIHPQIGTFRLDFGGGPYGICDDGPGGKGVLKISPDVWKASPILTEERSFCHSKERSYFLSREI
jgi:hypothetical protein